MYQVRVTSTPRVGAPDQVLQRSLAALHDPVPRLRRRGLLLLLGPVARVAEVPHHALLDPRRAAAGQALAVPRPARQLRARGIGIDRDPLVHQLLAQLGSAAGLGQEAAALVRLAGAVVEQQELDQVTEAAGSRITVYLPGSIARTSRLAAAFSVASRRPTRPGASARRSRPARPSPSRRRSRCAR